MSEKPRDGEPREASRRPLAVAIEIRLVIVQHPDGRWEVGCRDTAGAQHSGFAANWRAACTVAAHCASEIAAELLEAGRTLPRINGVIRP